MKFKHTYDDVTDISTTVEILYEVQTYDDNIACYVSTTVEILYEVQTLYFHACRNYLQQ